MTALAEVILYSIIFYLLTYGLGLGLSRIVLRNSSNWSETEPFYTPWLGIVHAGIILISLGFFGLGTKISCWVVLISGIVFFILSFFVNPKDNLLKEDEGESTAAIPETAPTLSEKPNGRKFFAVFHTLKEWLVLPKNRIRLTRITILCGVILISSGAMISTLLKEKRVTSFTIGNNDILDYVMCARYLEDHGLRRYIQPFGQMPAWKNPTIADRVLSCQIPAPRWTSYYYLSFLSAILNKDPAELYSLYIIFIYCLILPAIFIFAKKTLQIGGTGLFIGFLLALANPHILYIVFHGYIPQMTAMGFFICFLSLAPFYLEEENYNWRTILLISLFASGLLSSYVELFPFLSFVAVAYSVYLSIFRKSKVMTQIKKLLLLFGTTALLCPYQFGRVIDIFFLRAVGGLDGGWEVTNRYYLFLFQLGGFLSRPPQNPKPVLALEWILNPVIFLLIIFGLREMKRRSFVLISLFPFIITGFVAFINNYNYKYFKNFTYVYYFLPLLIGSGINFIEHDFLNLQIFGRNIKDYFRKIILCIVMCILVIAGAQSLKLAETIPAHNRFVPLEFNVLDKVNKNPDIRHVFAIGFIPWEALWVGYYLRDKNVVFPQSQGYLRSDVSEINSNQFEFILLKNNFQALFDPFGGRELKSEILRTNDFILYQLKKQSNRCQRIKLKKGFSMPENDSVKEWIRMDGSGTVDIESDGEKLKAVLEMKLFSLEDQRIDVIINGRKVTSFLLKKNAADDYHVSLHLKKGLNQLVLKSGGTGMTGIKIFGIRIS